MSTLEVISNEMCYKSSFTYLLLLTYFTTNSKQSQNHITS